MRRMLSLLALATLASLLVPAPAGADHVASPAGPALDDGVAAAATSALECPATFAHPEHEPLLLVHGTFTNGWENWSWNYGSALASEWDVCVVTLPNRALGDIQVSAQYVVQAVRDLHARSGRRVDVLGHSQGALQPRWAVRWWPDVQQIVDDLVMIGGPNHGTALAVADPRGCFPSCWQMKPGSAFLGALNGGDETPGGVSYTSIYSATDELVQPAVGLAPTAALDGASNVLIQDLCPGRPVEHAMLAADFAVHQVVVDALTTNGPADIGRLDPLTACAGVVFDGVDPVSHAATIFQRSREQGFPAWESAQSEPALRCYATPQGCGEAAAPSAGDGGAPAQSAGAALGAAGDIERRRALPATGSSGAPFSALGLLALSGAAWSTRRRSNR